MKVENIEVQDKTDDVIFKLRKLTHLYQQVNQLRNQKFLLSEYKNRVKNLIKSSKRQTNGPDSFKEKSSNGTISAQCAKLKLALKPCARHKSQNPNSELAEKAKPVLQQLKEHLAVIKETQINS